MKHKHAELIIAWANGAKIQVKDKQTGWEDLCCTPSWRNDFEYRIKPEPRPDDVRYACTSGEHHYRVEQRGSDNIRLTFDGETGELKSAEVLK